MKKQTKEKNKQKITKMLKSKKLFAHQKSQTISADMTIAEVVSRFPKVIPILMKYGLHCLGCPMAMQETLEQGLAGHGMNIDKIIEELNKVARKKKSKSK